jgi:hypothetical protein
MGRLPGAPRSSGRTHCIDRRFAAAAVPELSDWIGVVQDVRSLHRLPQEEHAATEPGRGNREQHRIRADHDRDDREQSRRPVHEVGITPASGKRFYSVPLHRRCRGHHPQAYPRADLPARPSRSAASGSRQMRTPNAYSSAGCDRCRAYRRTGQVAGGRQTAERAKRDCRGVGGSAVPIEVDADSQRS